MIYPDVSKECTQFQLFTVPGIILHQLGKRWQAATGWRLSIPLSFTMTCFTVKRVKLQAAIGRGVFSSVYHCKGLKDAFLLAAFLSV